MTKPPPKIRYLFGPVPSRRLGRSLGVDIIPMKTCSQNCLYCQLGRDGQVTVERKEYVPIQEVVGELKRDLEGGLTADYITISGSGEPTLHSGMGNLIDSIHKLTGIPVAVITNGSLLWKKEVRAACAKADLVLPSLDAGDDETFRTINQPHPDIRFGDFVDGLCAFRGEYKGPIWLEIFLCNGLNTSPESIAGFRNLVKKIRPDRVQLNTAVRPTAHPQALAVPPERLKEIAGQIGPCAEVIADYPFEALSGEGDADENRIVETLRRRPCTLHDLCGCLQVSILYTLKAIEHLTRSGKIRVESRQGRQYYILTEQP